MYRKYFFSIAVLLFLSAQLFISCDDSKNNSDDKIKTGRVTFVNESSYRVKVRRNSFSGPVEVELAAVGNETKNIRISEHGFGTTFSIEYLYRVNEAFDADNGEILASGLDFDVQINYIIEEGKSYTIQIPQPKNLEFRTAFIKLLNSNNLPCELRDFGRILQQAGTGNYPISPGKTGIYSLSGIPEAGELINGYRVVTTMQETLVPDFTEKNGVIYDFTYDGTSVVKTEEQPIIFK